MHNHSVSNRYDLPSVIRRDTMPSLKPKSKCPHGRGKYSCVECNPDAKCAHGKWRTKSCDKCEPPRIRDTNVQRYKAEIQRLEMNAEQDGRAITALQTKVRELEQTNMRLSAQASEAIVQRDRAANEATEARRDAKDAKEDLCELETTLDTQRIQPLRRDYETRIAVLHDLVAEKDARIGALQLELELLQQQRRRIIVPIPTRL